MSPKPFEDVLSRCALDGTFHIRSSGSCSPKENKQRIVLQHREEKIPLQNMLEVLMAKEQRAGAAETLLERVPLRRGIRWNRMEQEGGGRDNEPSKFKAMVGN